MTWSPNSTFLARLQSRQKAPLYALEIDGWPTVYTTGPVASATWAYQELLRAVDVDPGTIDPRSGRIQLSGLRVVLVDKDDAIKSLLATEKQGATLESLAGRQATLWMGFRGLAQADWEEIGVYRIDRVSLEAPGEYTIEAIDPLPELERGLFGSLGDGTRTQTRDISAADEDLLRVTDNADFTAGDHIVIRNDDGSYVFREIERVEYDDDGDLLRLTQEIGIDVDSGATVEIAYMLEGHPVDILMRVLLDDFSTSGTVQADWPLEAASGTFAEGDGFGLDESLFDKSAIQDERDTWLAEWTGRVYVTRRETRGSAWLRRYLHGLAFLFVRRDGKISMRGYHLPVAGSSPEELTSETASDWSWERRYPDIVTAVVVRGDEVGGERAQIAEVTDPDMLAAIGRKEVTIESPWLRTDLAGESLAVALASRWLARFADGHQVLRCSSHLERMVLEPADVVTVTHPHLPDTATAEAMDGAVGEVIAAAPQMHDGQIDFEVWRYARLRSGLITPDTMTDYSSASSAQRATYAFITDDDGYMPDSSSGYVWL